MPPQQRGFSNDFNSKVNKHNKVLNQEGFYRYQEQKSNKYQAQQNDNR